MPPHRLCLFRNTSFLSDVCVHCEQGRTVHFSKVFLHQAVSRPHPPLLSQPAQDSESELSISVHGQSFTSQKPSPVFRVWEKRRTIVMFLNLGMESKDGLPNVEESIISFYQFCSVSFGSVTCFQKYYIIRDQW